MLPNVQRTDAADHVPVLADEVRELLDVQPGETVVDATFGAGGHSRALAADLQGSGKLVAIDRDFGLDFKFRADLVLDNLRQRSAPVGRLPDYGGNFIEREKGGVHRRHDHHFTAQHTGCDGGAARDVGVRHHKLFSLHWIKSHTRASG